MTKTSEVDIFSSMNLSKVEPRLDRKETTPKKKIKLFYRHLNFTSHFHTSTLQRAKRS